MRWRCSRAFTLPRLRLSGPLAPGIIAALGWGYEVMRNVYEEELAAIQASEEAHGGEESRGSQRALVQVTLPSRCSGESPAG